jgi:RNA polymerase sigma-54 factor
MAQHELEQAIETELIENPALERLEDEHMPIEDAEILKAVAPQELRPDSEDFEFKRSLPQDEEGATWVDFAASSTSLWDHLRGELAAVLPIHLMPLGLYLVECVDARGYFDSTVEEVALATNSSLEETEFVFVKLRECEPAGVGATNVEDCLLLQLRRADTVERKLARVIIRSHMEDFMARRTQRICRRYKVLPEVVEAAFREILSLNPYPGETFQAGSSSTSIKPPAAVPDLVLQRTENGWVVEVRGADPGSLCLNRAYRRRLNELDRLDKPPKDERRHITTYVHRAEDFISCVQQRRRTLQRIGEYLVDRQAGFISTGRYQFLQPLTRAQMAGALGLHESTVSRATMEKFVQISNGEVVAFEVFFKPALRVQKMIEEILATENPHDPLSDERIAEILAERGVAVARRTVNKYRDRTKLLSSRKRRSA